MSSTKFHFHFEGTGDENNQWSCGMRISAGNYEVVGQLLADYALAELKKGHAEPMRILVACLAKLQQGMEKPGTLVRPIDKYKAKA